MSHAVNPYFNKFNFPGEQKLHADLMDESIHIMGHEIQYIPRSEVKFDALFGEDTLRAFRRYFSLAALYDANPFAGRGDFFNKFGFQINDQTTFYISTRMFQRAVPPQLRTLPQEGDLVRHVLSGNLFEIKFVEDEEPFFQHGTVPMWKLVTEIFQYSHEKIETKDTVLDNLARTSTYRLRIGMGSNGNAIAFQIGEAAQQGNTVFEVASWASSSNTLDGIHFTGNIVANAHVVGLTSGANHYAIAVDMMNDVNDQNSANVAIEEEADEIVDWSEENPFGPFGNL